MGTKNKSWYEIKAAQNGGQAEILIYTDIGDNWWSDSISAKNFVKDLQTLKGQDLLVRINSPGGSVFDGIAIYNALKNHNGKVTTQIDGMALSIASVVALAGSEIKMADNAFFMIHQPWTVAMGNSKELLQVVDTLDKIGGTLAETYAKHTGKDVADVQKLMDDETWFTAAEAKDAGFVTEVTEGAKVAAKFDLSRFKNTPSNLKIEAFLQEATGMNLRPIEPASEVSDIAQWENAAQKEAEQQRRERMLKLAEL